MKKTLLLNRSLFLLLGVILLLPVFGINAGEVLPVNYNVDPYDYSINVGTGDSRTYVFQQIRISSHDETSMITEVNEMQMEMQFGGVTENVTINEGTKVKVEIVEINDFEIILSQVFYLLDGPVYSPDNFAVNRSNLVLRDDSGPRFIMTTNDSLINQVYDGFPEWNKELYPDFVRFSRDEWNETYGYGSSEYYEYDGYSRFLRSLNIHNSHEDGYMDIELKTSYEMNPDHYALGVTTGASQYYTLTKITFYDWGQGTYFHDIPIQVKQGDSTYHYNLEQGDRIYVEVTDTSGDYVKFKTRYYPKDKPEIHDDTVHILDKTTGYFSLNRILHGPPILVTVNTSLINQYAPFEMEITDSEIKYSSYWKDEYHEQSDSGSWDKSTGWLNRYWREEKEEGIIKHEFEIITGNLTSEFAVGVNAGDSNTLQFTDILMRNEDGSSTENFLITTRSDDSEVNLTMRVPDKIDVIIDKVEGYNITMHMVFHSSLDGEITADSFTVNIVNANENSSQGPMFVIPTDPKVIDDVFEGIAEVTYDGDKVYIDSYRTYDSTSISRNYIYDISTGWVIRMFEVTEVDGVEVQRFAAESVGVSTSPDDTTTIPTLTPISLWPTILFLIIAAPIYRRKR